MQIFFLASSSNDNSELFASSEKNNIAASISADKLNVLYIGVDNPIRIAIAGISINNTKASISKGEITQTSRFGELIVRVNEVGNTTITLERKDEKGRKFNYSKVFRVRKLPDPEAYVGKGMRHPNGNISLQELKQQSGLRLKLSNSEFKTDFEIISFLVTTGCAPRTECLYIKNEGFEFNEIMKTVINRTEIDDLYYFSDIMVKGKDGSIREIAPISFKVRRD